MHTNLTIVIHTRNEEHHIVDCITSAKLVTNNIVIVDMESEDQTVVFAKNYHVPIVTFPFSRYVEPARTFGIRQAKTPWVFLLDADERITPELGKELQQVTEHIPQTAHETTHYKVPRKELYNTGKWLKHGGWWPNHQFRLLHIPSLLDWPPRIHATPHMQGTEAYLEHALLHYSKGDFDAMVNKTINFEDIESDLLYKAKRPVRLQTFGKKFLGELWRRLIKKQGYKDGAEGVLESMYQAFSKTITYLYLYEKTYVHTHRH